MVLQSDLDSLENGGFMRAGRSDRATPHDRPVLSCGTDLTVVGEVNEGD